MAKRIGEVLRQTRLEAGLSTRDMERLTGMSTAALSQIETGARRDPGFSTILKLARAIGVSMEDLALRMEGRAAAGASGAGKAVASALADIERTKADAGRLVARLEKAAKTLSPALAPTKKDVPRRKRRT